MILKHIQNKVQPEQKKEEAEPPSKPPKQPAKKSSKQWRTLEDVQGTPPPPKGVYEDEQDTTLAKVEKIQANVLVRKNPIVTRFDFKNYFVRYRNSWRN